MNTNKPDRLLALDPSTKVIGWAQFDGDDLVDCGAYHVRGDNLDDKMADAAIWIDHHMGAAYILALEMPVMWRNVKTTVRLAQMVGALRLAAFPYARAVVEIMPGSRLLALGLRINMKRAEAKKQVVRLVNAMFSLELTAKDHDAADAVAVGLAALKKMKLEALDG